MHDSIKFLFFFFKMSVDRLWQRGSAIFLLDETRNNKFNYGPIVQNFDWPISYLDKKHEMYVTLMFTNYVETDLMSLLIDRISIWIHTILQKCATWWLFRILSGLYSNTILSVAIISDQNWATDFVSTYRLNVFLFINWSISLLIALRLADQW